LEKNIDLNKAHMTRVISPNGYVRN